MRQQVQEVFFKTPKNKQTMCFSATLAQEMRTTVSKFVNKVTAPVFSPPKRVDDRTDTLRRPGRHRCTIQIALAAA